MVALLQRVTSASVYLSHNPKKKNSIKNGLCILLGVAETDTEKDADKIIKKIANIRIFTDSKGKMNLGLKESNSKILLVPQFTLTANCKKGNRPSFSKAANPQKAKIFYLYVARELTRKELPVKTGFFGEYMKLDLKLDGPVTIDLNSEKL